MKQEPFGEKIGVTRSAVSGYESGHRNPSNNVLKSICREFNVNEDYLFYGIGDSNDMFIKTQDDELEELRVKYNMDDLDLRLMREYMKLSPDQKNTFKLYFSRVFGGDALAPDDEIECKTAAYRQELEAEKRMEMSEVLPSIEDGSEKIS